MPSFARLDTCRANSPRSHRLSLRGADRRGSSRRQVRLLAVFRVLITGVLRSSAIRSNARQRKVKSIFRTFIDVLHISFVDEAGSSEKREPDIDQLQEMASDKNAYQALANSIGTSFLSSFSSRRLATGRCQEGAAASALRRRVQAAQGSNVC